MMADNNQHGVGGSDKGDVRAEARWAGSVWGDLVSLFGASNRATKINKHEIHHGLRWPPPNEYTHNNQPKTGDHNGGEYGGKV